MARLFLTLIGFAWSSLLCGQFVFNGSARRVDSSGCYQLTGTNTFESGSIWHTDKINLNQSFQVVAEVFLGCLDAGGADGLVFGFQPVSTSIGQAGEGIGFQGVAPSIGLEMDTYQNFNLSDPDFDHMALIANGNLDHRVSLVGPVALLPDSANAEDCKYHHLQVTWDASSFNLKVYFDCRLMIDYTRDLVRTIFGQPEVFWGFTAATGGSVNIHGICLNYTTFLNDIPDYVICPGMAVSLDVMTAGSFRWTPQEGLMVPGQIAADQWVRPDRDITYKLLFEGPCDTFVIDTVQIDVLDRPPAPPWPDTVTICPDSSILLGYPFLNGRYLWSTGDTSAQIRVTQPGPYGLLFTRWDTICTQTDSIEVLPAPSIGPDLILDTVLCAGESLWLDVSDPSVVLYTWKDGFSGPVRTIATPGQFDLDLSNGCTERMIRISTTIDVCGQVYIPNVFSPNQDGYNDVFQIYASEALILKSVQIFDRWGNLVFAQESGNINQFSWNGTTADGIPYPVGVFVYRAIIEITPGINKIFSGDVTLVR